MCDEKKASGTKSLSDDDIITRTGVGRRSFLTLALASTTVIAGTTEASAADVDNGGWTDNGSCPRGYGGIYTGATDADNGQIADQPGYGRGAPYC